MRYLVLAAATWLLTCGPTEEPIVYVGPRIACDDINDEARAVLQEYCERCHSPELASGGFGSVTEVEQFRPARRRAVASRTINGTMPPPGTEPRPSPRDLAVLETWLDCSGSIP